MANIDTTGPFTNAELLDLLRDSSVSAQAIASEMREAGAEPLPLDALESARRVLQTLAASDSPTVEGLPAALRHLLVEQAAATKATEFLAALVKSANKDIVKDAKRAIHLLKTRGVTVEAPRPTPPPPSVGHTHAEEFPTFMSSIDGAGERIVILCSPARGGVDVVQVALSDEVGIISATLSPLGRKDYKRFIQGLSHTKLGLLGEVPRAYARGLIAAALDLNAKARKPVPPSFNDICFLLGPVVPNQASPGRALPMPADRVAAMHRATDLLNADALRSWLPPEDMLNPLLLKVEEIELSPLYIDETQREQTARHALAETVKRFWTTERRRLWTDRLFDTAFLLKAAGQVELAECAVATAHALESDDPIESIPFCYSLFEVALPTGEAETVTATEPAEIVTDSGLILPG